MPITIYPGTVKKRNTNGTYSDLVPGADANPQLANDIAEEYDPVAGVYSVGDYCIYQTVLYKCTTAISTPEAFDNTKWERTAVTDEVSSLKNTLNSFEEEMVIVVNGSQAAMQIANQQLVLLKNSTVSGKTDGLYRATQLIPQGTTITAAYLSNPITIGGLNEIQRDFWNRIALEAVAITANSTYVSQNSLFGRSFGGVVAINGYLKLNSAAYTGTHTLATIQAGKRPIDVLRFPIEVADQAYNPGIIAYGSINADGELAVNIPSGNTRSAVYFNVSYIAQV